MADEFIEEEVLDGSYDEEIVEGDDFIEEEVIDDDLVEEYEEESYTEESYENEQPTPANMNPEQTQVAGTPAPAPIPVSVETGAPTDVPVSAPIPAAVGTPVPVPAPAPVPALDSASQPAVGAPAPTPATAPRLSSEAEGYEEPNSVEALKSWVGDFERGQASEIRPRSPNRPYPFEVHDVRPAATSAELAQPTLATTTPATARAPMTAQQQNIITPQPSQDEIAASSPPETPLQSNVSPQVGKPVSLQPDLAPAPAPAPATPTPTATPTAPTPTPTPTPTETDVATATSTSTEVATERSADVGPVGPRLEVSEADQPQQIQPAQAPAPAPVTQEQSPTVEQGDQPASGTSGDVEAFITQKQGDTPTTSKEAKTEGEESEENRSGLIYILAILLVLILTVLAILAILIWGTETIDDPFRDDDGPDFVGDIPTTPMDSYVPDSCDFEGQKQPHVISQCNCNDEISDLTNDAREKYNALVSNFLVPTVYPSWDLPFKSCETANQALVWLSTVTARDETDLLQKYIMAYLYFGTNGPNWDVQTNWISDEDVCDWHGLFCEEEVVQSVELESNSLMGMV